MPPQIEELGGKLLLLAAFGWLAIGKIVAIGGLLASRPASWPINLLVQVVTLAFVALVVVMTLRRLPPRSSAQGIEARASAIAGTFLLLALVWLPGGSAPPAIQAAAATMIVTGSLLSIYCLSVLGTSFSVLASARELVTRGPYGIVRHPLYAVEAVTVAGIILSHWSVGALGIGVAQIALQLRRMMIEERVLRAAFPDYDAYAARVPMLVPRGLLAGA